MKIEVGKKYWTRDKTQWAEVLKDVRTMPNYDNKIKPYPEYSHLVVYSDGDHGHVTEEGRLRLESEFPYDLVEEYHEPIKRSVEGWADEAMIDNLLEFNFLYRTRNEAALIDSDNTKKIKITVEQLPDPKE